MRKLRLILLASLILLVSPAQLVRAQATEIVTVNLNGIVPHFNEWVTGTLQLARTGDATRTTDRWQANLKWGTDPCVASGTATEVWDDRGMAGTITSIDSWQCSEYPPPPVPSSIRIGTDGNTMTFLGLSFSVNPPLQRPFADGNTYSVTGPAGGVLPPNYGLPTGEWYTQTASKDRGYGVRNMGTDSQGNTIRFWDYFQMYGGVDCLGYPVSQVYTLPDGFTYQTFQRGTLQWRSDIDAAVLMNTLDQLSSIGLDPWLEAVYGISPRLDDASHGDLNLATEIRLSWLTNPAIKDMFLANPSPNTYPDWGLEDSLNLYGLPTSMPERSGPFIIQRFQRGALQLWVNAVPNMPAPGTVVAVLAGDIFKASGLMPASAAQPETP